MQLLGRDLQKIITLVGHSNALPAVIIFIRICVFDVLFSVKNKGRSKLEANGFSVTNSRDC